MCCKLARTVHPNATACICTLVQELADQVEIESGLVDLGGSRGLCHWMTIVPADFNRVNKVMVFFHGFSDHVGSNYQNFMLT